jgi:membrane protease YdiL (CAAX protease family)
LKEIGKILLYLIATVVLGALFAPVLFWGSHALAHAMQNQRFTAFIEGTDFQRFFNRAVLVAAFALLWPLVRALHIRNFREDLGLERDRQPWGHFFAGFGFAMLTMLLLGTCLIMLRIYLLKTNIPWGRVASLLLTAGAVATIEEFLFRGAIQGVVQRTVSGKLALVFVAILFAAIHFIKPPENVVAPNEITWSSGFSLVPHVFWQFEQPKLLLGGFSTILLVGLILGFARMRTRSLWMPIGLHAGWIFGKMGFSKITKRAMEAWPWFGSDVLVGFGPVIALLLTWCIVWIWLRNADAR